MSGKAEKYSKLQSSANHEQHPGRLTSTCLIVTLTVAITAVVTSVAFMSITYVQHQQERSCTCSAPTTYYITGYDAGIEWKPELRNKDSIDFENAARLQAWKIRSKLAFKGISSVDHINVLDFSQGQDANGANKGSIFYMTLRISGRTLPAADELKAFLRQGQDSIKNRNDFRIFDAEIINPLAIREYYDNGSTSKISSESAKIREKRSILDEKIANEPQKESMLGVGLTCPPQMTGQYCQNPICPTKGPIPKPPSGSLGFGRTVDLQQKDFPCQGSTTIPVDSHTQNLSIIIESGKSAYPKMTFTDPSGHVLSPSEYKVIIQTSSQFIVKINNVMPGIWSLQYSGDKQSCQIISFAQTNLTINQGFVSGRNGIFQDTPSPFIYSGVPSYFVARPNNLTIPGAITYLEVYNNHQVIWASAAQKRYHCAYEFYFGVLYCDLKSTYYYKIYGIDENGYSFQRTDVLRCRNGTTPPPPTEKPGQCSNGGTQVHGICLCPSLFRGPNCQFYVCQNGGTPAPDQSGCFCPPGFTGDHCQNVQCTKHPQKIFYRERSLAFVIGTRYTMIQDVDAVKNAAKDIIAEFNSIQPGVILNYILTQYVDNKVQTGVYANATDFMNALDSVHFGGFQNCTQGVISALFQTLNQLIPASPVFIFSDALPSDGRLMESLMFANSLKQAQFNFILTRPPTSVPECQWTENSPDFQLYQSLSAFSMGSTIDIQKASVYNTTTTFYMLSLHRTSTIVSKDYAKCSSQPSLTTFFQDSTTAGILVTATGSYGTTPSLVTSDPNGVYHFPTPFYSSGNFVIYFFRGQTGLWTLKMANQNGNQGACQFRVLGFSNLTVFTSFTSSINTDFSKPQPDYNVPIHPVAHITTHTVPYNGAPVAASQMVITDPNGKTLYMSTGRYRNSFSCQYKLFYNSWACQNPGQMFYMTVYGQDINGFNFQRTTTSFCGSSSPPTNKCLNGGVLSDGVCYCPAYWTGTHCQTALCQNGGTSVGKSCQCVPGFNGTHCENTLCTSKNVNVMNSPNNRSLAFVIQMTITTIYDLSQIQSSINFTLKQINRQSPNWISRYILITFDNQKVYNQIVTQSQTAFYQAVMGLQIQFNTGPCPKPISTALIAALSSTYQFGIVYVFTDSSFSDTSSIPQVYSLLESTYAQINFVVTSITPCTKNFYQPSTQAFVLLSQFSDGQLIILEKEKVGRVLGEYVPLSYNGALIFEGGTAKCQSGKTYYIPIDSHTDSFSVVVTGHNPNSTIITPNGVHLYGEPLLSDSQFTDIQRVRNRGDQIYVPGIWQVTVQTTPTVGSTKSCYFQIRGQTTLNLYYGFVRNIHNDFPTKEPLQVPGYSDMMVGHVTNLPSNGMLEYLNLYTEISGKLAGSARFSRRAGCGYEFVSQPFKCPSAALGLVATGHDENNYEFRRIRTAMCNPSNNPCQNGAVYKNNKCYCPSNWVGPTCRTPRCYNGGSVSGSICQCPDGFTGPNCQYDQCLPKVPTTFSPNNKSLAFVIDMSQLNSQPIKQLKLYMSGILNELKKAHPDWYTRFILVPYYDLPHIVKHVTVTTSSDVFVQAIQGAELGTGKRCQTFGNEALLAALNYAYPNSPIYVISSGTTGDPGYQSKVITAATAKQVQINFVIASADPCKSNWSTNDYLSMTNVAQATNGNIFFVGDKLRNFLFAHMITQYQAGTIAQYSHPNSCTNLQTLYFPVDSQTSAVSFTVNGQNPFMQFINPNGNIINPSTIASSFYQTIGYISHPTPGVWSLKFKATTGGCQVRVHATSPLQVYFGFQGNIHSDNPRTSAIGGANTNNYVIAHVSNLTGSNSGLEYANFFTPSYVIGESTRISKRVNCSYEYYSQVFHCPSKQLGIIFSGTDNKGYTFQRQLMAECAGGPTPTKHPVYPSSMSTKGPTIAVSSTTPSVIPTAGPTMSPSTASTAGSTTATAPPGCALSSLKYDIVFAYDDSANIKPAFNQMTSMMESFASNFTFNNVTGTQFALVHYNSVAGLTAPFNLIKTLQTFNIMLGSYPVTSINGQNYANAFNLIQSNLEQTSSGYRPSVDHITVLISSAPGNPNPINDATALRKSGMKILALAYGSANVTQLAQVTGGSGCVVKLTNPSDFSTVALPWLNAKMCSKQWCS